MYEEAHSILFDYSEFIESTDISEINISDKKVVMTFRDSNIKLICNKGDKRIPPIESINLSKYEEEEMKMQIKLIESNYSIFDIGANIGWYSIYLASRFPNANIYAFEPVKQTYEHLCENIKLNKLTNIQSLNFGFSDHE
jgi:predicted O-methyltransferase YrrM